MLTRQNLDVTWEDSRLVAAPLRTVWQLHTDINSWPTWNGEVLAAQLDGPLAARSSFTATTAAGCSQIRIYALDEEQQVFWGSAIGGGTTWLQAWAFLEMIGGVQLVVMTSVIGSDPGSVSQVASHLHEAVERWLDQLQPEAESHTSPNA